MAVATLPVGSAALAAPLVAHPAPDMSGPPDPAGGIDDDSYGEDEDDEAGRVSLRAKGTHRVTVRVAVDEEWRNQIGGRWKRVANSILEEADRKMYDEFGINLKVVEYHSYTSKDSLGDRECALLDDLDDKVNRNGADIVVGFLGQGRRGGCAYRNGTHAVILRSRDYAEWKLARHEVSHLFDARDRYIQVAGDNPRHRDDVMEDPYDHPDRWTSPDHRIMKSNRAKFD